MGPWHQAFIIARVIPHGNPPCSAQYRCVGALIQQFYSLKLPLIAVTRFMKLIKQEDNAAIIREEIRAIDGLYGKPNPPIPDLPCPFTSFLLLLAWSTDLSNPGSRSPSQTDDICFLEAGAGGRDTCTNLYTHFVTK